MRDIDEKFITDIPPRVLQEYLSLSSYQRMLVRSSDQTNHTPSVIALPPLGAWMIDDSVPLSTAEIWQLVELPVANIEISEDTGPKKRPDVERYARWLLEGHNAPPIRIVQVDSGRLKTKDHRRLMAAKLIGSDTINAWVNWAVLDTKSTPTGLTFGLASVDAKRLPVIGARPGYTIFADDAKWLEKAKKAFFAHSADDSESPTLSFN